ncbi:MAG TPA: energy transducer TonB [Candidatus Acidoferrum sp.]|nr:energy transducer TonB [Candidatus Acidoferrum sp.]
MKLIKANLAGLTSPGQRSEMKSILAGSWPPLKPLPVFKYETTEYRATIDFDKKRGEWVCRKTSLPSNEVQELRGGLRAITMALPHGEEKMLTEGAEQQEQELEKDTNRRLQAIREWREKYQNGAHYFELREFLSEGQRAELDDSLRQTLTARQLQFNSRNVADVFDDLSVAGGRFAALIEFATRSKANAGTDPQPPEEGALLEAEPEVVNDKQTLEVSSRELEPVLTNATNPTNPVPNNADPPVQDQEAAEWDTNAADFPAVSIKNVFPEQEQPSMAERMAHAASQQFEIENSEIVEEDPALLVEPPPEEGDRSPAFAVFAAQVRAGQSFAEPIGASSWRFPALKISAFHVNVFAILFLFAATAFTVGLTVGRGPVGKRLREPPQSLLVTDAKPPALPDATPDASDESTPRTPPPQVASSDDSAGISRPADAAPSAEESMESSPGAGPAEARSTNADSFPAVEPKPTAKPELPAEHSSEIAPMVRSMRPPASSKILRRPKRVRSTRTARRIPSPYRLTSTIAATPHPIGAAPPLPRTSTILVNVPERESQPFRVSFPNKTIAATSSLAMTSQLSVLVSPEPWPVVAHKSARLEAGELVSFVWPHFLGPRGRYGLAETIRVRASIGQTGQVQEVKLLGGSASLLPATMDAVRQWRYRPTLMDKRPVQAQQDITIEFRPPQYSARLSTQHPSHN